MKNRFVYVAAVALMASGMVLAQNSTSPSTTQSGNSVTTAPETGGNPDVQGNLPAAKENEAPCVNSRADMNSDMPGAMGANLGTSPKDTGRKGTEDNSSSADYVEGQAEAGYGR